MMSKGNDNGALKLLTENMSDEVSLLTGKTLKMLKPKHPGANEPLQEVVLPGPIRPVHPTVYEDMNEFLIFNAAVLTKGGSGPSGLDADGWRKIFTSRSFGTATASSELCKTFALLVERLWSNNIRNTESLESFIACRLIILDKRPGLRQLGEVLRRIVGKGIIIVLKKNILQATGLLQLRGGQVAESEAAIHVMHDIFNDDNARGILLIDAENAFYSISRKVILDKFRFICPVIAIYIFSCYVCPARLSIIGGGELLSKEGTTQSDST